MFPSCEPVCIVFSHYLRQERTKLFPENLQTFPGKLQIGKKSDFFTVQLEESDFNEDEIIKIGSWEKRKEETFLPGKLQTEKMSKGSRLSLTEEERVGIWEWDDDWERWREVRGGSSFSFSAFHLEVFYFYFYFLWWVLTKSTCLFYYIVFWRFSIMLQNSTQRWPRRVVSNSLLIPALNSFLQVNFFWIIHLYSLHIWTINLKHGKFMNKLQNIY